MQETTINDILLAIENFAYLLARNTRWRVGQIINSEFDVDKNQGHLPMCILNTER